MKFKKKKKEIENKTDLTIYDIFHIKAPEPASVFIEGTGTDFINIIITTGAMFYTMKLKAENKTIRKELIEFWEKNNWTANEKNTIGGVGVISKAAYNRLINNLT